VQDLSGLIVHAIENDKAGGSSSPPRTFLKNRHSPCVIFILALLLSPFWPFYLLLPRVSEAKNVESLQWNIIRKLFSSLPIPLEILLSHWYTENTNKCWKKEWPWPLNILHVNWDITSKRCKALKVRREKWVCPLLERWVAKLLARLVSRHLSGFRIQTSLKNHKSYYINKGVADRVLHAKRN
jgi:hypothetical protein